MSAIRFLIAAPSFLLVLLVASCCTVNKPTQNDKIYVAADTEGFDEQMLQITELANSATSKNNGSMDEMFTTTLGNDGVYSDLYADSLYRLLLAEGDRLFSFAASRQDKKVRRKLLECLLYGGAAHYIYKDTEYKKIEVEFKNQFPRTHQTLVE